MLNPSFTFFLYFVFFFTAQDFTVRNITAWGFQKMLADVDEHNKHKLARFSLGYSKNPSSAEYAFRFFFQ